MLEKNIGEAAPIIASSSVVRAKKKALRIKADILQSAIFNSVNFSSIATDCDGVIQIFNVGAEHMLGFAATDVLNKLTPADISDPLELIARAKLLSAELETPIAPGFEALVYKASRGIEDIYELTYIRKNGSRFPAALSVTALRDDSEVIIGYLLIGTDNTAREELEAERKRSEEAQCFLKDDLENQVHLRTGELEVANRELEAFAYSISHDLRAPLRAIDGFSRKVVANYGLTLGEEGRRLLQVVRDNAQKMGNLIDDLLAFSGIGRREIAAQTLDMDRMVKGVVDEIRAAEPQRAIAFAVSPLANIRGDAAMIRQVWVNLLTNAVKFTRIRALAHIEIGGRIEGPDALYWVKDDGAGFDERYAEKLFGVFQRLHRQDEFEGTGVGLAIAQRIVQRHKGRIWGEGKPEAGASFFFVLPLPQTQLSGGERS